MDFFECRRGTAVQLPRANQKLIHVARFVTSSNKTERGRPLQSPPLFALGLFYLRLTRRRAQSCGNTGRAASRRSAPPAGSLLSRPTRSASGGRAPRVDAVWAANFERTRRPADGIPHGAPSDCIPHEGPGSLKLRARMPQVDFRRTSAYLWLKSFSLRQRAARQLANIRLVRAKTARARRRERAKTIQGVRVA